MLSRHFSWGSALLGLLVPMMLLINLLPTTASAESYFGMQGEQIDYRTGTLTLSEVELVLQGRHGFDVTISRNYSSNVYEPLKVESADEIDLSWQYRDSVHSKYLGLGWHMQFPYLVSHNDTDYIAYGDGTREKPIINVDTLTESRFPRKTRSLSLLTDNWFGPNILLADTMLNTDGSKWVFDHLITSDHKFLTKIIGRLGDTIHIEYHDGRSWMKKITSPIGRVALYEYQTYGDSLFDMTDTPPEDSVRLHALVYLNHNDDTLRTVYSYSNSTSLGPMLTKVKYHSGDSVMYSYSTSINFNAVADWEFDDTLSYNDTQAYYEGKRIWKITGPNGAVSKFKWRHFNLPTYSPCDGNFHWTNNPPYSFNPDTASDYNSFIGVNKHIVDNDTVLFVREGLSHALFGINSCVTPSVQARTTVEFPKGGREEYFFYADYDCRYSLQKDPEWVAGVVPGALSRIQTIYGTDTVCTVIDQGGGHAGLWPGNIGIEAYHWQDTTVYPGDDTVITNYYDTLPVYVPRNSLSHHSAPFYYPDTVANSPTPYHFPYYLVGQERQFSTYTVYDTTLRVRIANMWGQKIDTISMLFFTHYCPWGTFGDTCTPDLTANDTLAAGIDSTLEWEYLPDLNMTLVYKTWKLIKKDTFIVAGYTEYEYDSTHGYQISKITTYLDSNYATDTTRYVSEFGFDEHNNVVYETKPSGKTLYAYYDIVDHARLWKTVDSSFANLGVITLAEHGHYPDGKPKWDINLYDDTTFYFYDAFGRDSIVRGPSIDISSFSIARYYNNTNMEKTTKINIDSLRSLTMTVKHDKNYKKIQSIAVVDSTESIIDTTVYNSNGTVKKHGQRKYASDTTDWIWTEYEYDLEGRLQKTIYPDGDSVYTERLSYFSADRFDILGTRKRTIVDYSGNIIETHHWDTAGVVDTISSTYNARGQVLMSTDFEGLTRTNVYSDRGQLKKATHPDVGDKYWWYNKFGKTRFFRSNSDSVYSYLKYDSENRLIEFGSIINPDTTKVDSISYPASGDSPTVYVVNVYDAYSDSTIASDTVNGKHYFIGKLTEQYTFNEDNDTTGYEYYYYDRNGQITLKTTWVIGLTNPQRLQYVYTSGGMLSSCIYPDTSKTSYAFDNLGRLKGITGVFGEDSIAYEPWGAIRSIDYVNGMHTQNSYDNMGRTSKTLNYSWFMTFYSRGFEYNKGFIEKEFDLDTLGNTTNYGMIRQYQYDARGHLDTAFLKDPAGVAPNRTMRYNYDNNSNLTYKTLASADSLSYNHFDSSNGDSLVEFFGNDLDSTWVFTRNDKGLYDTLTVWKPHPDSTILWDRRTIFQYDYRNLLTLVILQEPIYNLGDGPDTILNVHNAVGQKVKQTRIRRTYISGGNGTAGSGTNGSESIGLGEGGGGAGPMGPGGGGGGGGGYVRSEIVRYYIWSGNQIVLEMNNPDSVNQIHVYGLGQRIATRNLINSGADSTMFYVNDAQGTVRSFIRSDGIPSMRYYEYFPYGQLYAISGTDNTNYHFIGKEDDATGETDFGPRYYSSELGRFLAPDPALSDASTYGYSGGNPIMRYDPTGLYWDLPHGPQWYRDRSPGGSEWKKAMKAQAASKMRFEESLGRQAALFETRGNGFKLLNSDRSTTNHLAPMYRTGRPITAGDENIPDNTPLTRIDRYLETRDGGTGKIIGWDYINSYYVLGDQTSQQYASLDVPMINVDKYASWMAGWASRIWAVKMFGEFATGLGAKNNSYKAGDLPTLYIMTSAMVALARAGWGEKNASPLENGAELVSYGPVTESYAWKLGFVSDWNNAPAEFTGSMTITITPIDNGTRLRFTVTNETSFWSFSYHTQESWDRVPGETTPMGTTYQSYEWTEPIEK